MNSIPDQLPRNPYKTIKINNVSLESLLDYHEAVEDVIKATDWVDPQTGYHSFGVGVYNIPKKGKIRFYSTGKIDCIGFSNPVKGYKHIHSTVEKLKNQGKVQNSNYNITISNLSASATLGTSLDLKQLYLQLPTALEVQPMEEDYGNLNFWMSEENINVDIYNNNRNLESMEMSVTVYNSGKIQIKGARHPKMVESAIKQVLTVDSDQLFI